MKNKQTNNSAPTHTPKNSEVKGKQEKQLQRPADKKVLDLLEKEEYTGVLWAEEVGDSR